VSVGQPFTLTLVATKTGNASATVSSVVLNTAAAGICAGQAPATPPVPFTTTTFTWTCTPVTAGAISLNATVNWVDNNVPGTPHTAIPATAAAVTVQAAAAVTATISASAATVSVGQPFTLTLVATKTGAAAATVSSITLNPAAAICTGQAPPTPINPFTTTTFTWTCTPVTAGAISLNATVNWVDNNAPGTPLTAVPATAATVTVQAAAGVTATSIAATPAPLSVGQTFSITLTLTKSGTSSANVTGVSMDYAGFCAVAPAMPVNNIAATQVLTWTGCTAPATQQLLPISGFATWVDANVPGTSRTTNSTSTAVSIQAPAALVVTFAAQPPSPVSAGQVVTLVANVQNTAPAGGSAANGVTVTPTVAGTGASATCTAATPGATTIAANTAQAFTFTCTPAGAGTLTFTATANGTAANTGTALTATATTSPATTIQ
jgi:hypothetical protein